MSTDVVAILEKRYLPRFEVCAQTLRANHQRFTVRVGSDSIGSLTTYQARNLYIECFRAESDLPEPNCVALEVCVRDLPGIPTLCTLDVCWGGDGVSPCHGIDLLDSEIVFGDEALAKIDEALPVLMDHLQTCVSSWEDKYLKDA